MADEFKTFDKTPIIGMVHISKWSFGLREIILAIIAALLLVMVLIFAGLFGNAKTQLTESTSAANAAKLVGSNYCTDFSCLKAAAHAAELMNTSVDPCENFFEFACGNYKVVKPVFSDGRSRNILNDIYYENQQRLTDVLESPVSTMHDYAAERKLKEFFQSCNDMYTRQRNKGTPFLTKILPELGGWKVLGTWNEETWDLNTALKKVHADFWVDALYDPRVDYDWANDIKQRVIALRPGGTGKWMYWSWYTRPELEQYREDYRKFIRRVGSYLLRDAVGQPLQNETLQQQYLEEFVNDTFNMENNIAQIAGSSRYYNNPYEEENKVTLQELNTETGNVIDFVTQMSYLFNRASITGSKKVVVLRREYFQNMTRMISSLPDADRKRMLHNYLIWRVAETYVQELSWDYIHASREVYVDMFGRPNFIGLYRYCFYTVQSYMNDALSALFISEHFVEDSKDMVHDITDNIKKALQSQLDKTPWMDDYTKKYAKEKLDRVTFKMGYPDWMANRAAVDQLYNALTINVSDFFGNLLSANQYRRAEWNEQLIGGEDREEWRYATYGTVIGVLWYLNEITATAGIMQEPIYNKDQPHHATFGSLGSLLGRFLHHVVDEWGKWYDHDGADMHPSTWWTNKTMTNYAPIKQCVVDVYSNISKTYRFPDGSYRSLAINAGYYAPMAISYTNGVRLAQIAYKDWLSSQGKVEKMLPGLDMTNEQMIYLAHAQTFCYSRTPTQSLNMALRRSVEEDLRVNNALGQLEEFSTAFNCKPQSKMNHAKKCDYY